MIWGSSQTDPNYANYKGSMTYNFNPVASYGGKPVNEQGFSRIQTSGGGSGGGGGGSWGSPAPAPAPQNNTMSGFDMKYYPGWGETAARADYAATGGKGKYIQDQQDAFNKQLEADYNNAMNELGNQESSLRGQAGTAEGMITNEAAKTRTALGQEQGTQEQGVQASLSTAEKQGTSAMQQARDVFRQTQQQNIAQLSALGISSSSVAEALAERLGVDVARRIAGVTGSIQEVRQNATNELGRIKNYFGQKMTQLQTDEQLQKQQIQQSLVQGLNQINSARNKAASDKAAARSNLMSQAQQAIATLTQQKQQFEQALQQWTAQKQAALTPIAQNPQYALTNQRAENTFTQSFTPQGLPKGWEAVPNYDQYGRIKGYQTVRKQEEEGGLF